MLIRWVRGWLRPAHSSACVGLRPGRLLRDDVLTQERVNGGYCKYSIGKHYCQIMQSLKDLLPKAVKNAGISRQIEAVQVVQTANEVITELIGPGVIARAQAIYFKDKTITIACLSSILSQELQLAQTQIIDRINQRFDQPVVAKLRFFMWGIIKINQNLCDWPCGYRVFLLPYIHYFTHYVTQKILSQHEYIRPNLLVALGNDCNYHRPVRCRGVSASIFLSNVFLRRY